MKNAQDIGDSGKKLLSPSCAFKNNSVKRVDYLNTTRWEEKQVVYPGGEAPESPSRTRSIPKHKTSHLKFLVWVAYLRNSSLHVDEIQRKTCPLIGCQTWSETPEAMLEHVYSCPFLSKGRYRCPECGKEEPISKQHMDGCPDSNTCKDWLAHPFKCVKSRLSRRGSNGSSAQSPVSPQDTQYLPYYQPNAYKPCSGDVDYIMKTGFKNRWQELDSSSRMELGDTSSPVELSCTPSQQCCVRDDPQSRLHAISPPELEPQNNLPYATMAIAELDAWPGKNPPCAYFTDSGSSVPRAPFTPIARKPVYSSPTNHAYLDFRRPPSPKDLPGLDLVNISTSRSGVVATESFLSPLSSSVNQQCYPGGLQPSPTDSRASTSMPSMTKSPTESMGSLPTPINESTLRMSFTSKVENTSAASDFMHDFTKSGMIYQEAETYEDLATQQEPSAGSLYQIGLCSEQRAEPINVASWVFENESCYQVNEKLHDQLVYTPYQRAPTHNESMMSPSLGSLARSCHNISKSTYKCVCGYAPRGQPRNKRQNFKRHQETCRVLFPSSIKEKPYTCSFQNCTRAFTRPDNLLVHQRTRGHLEDVELDLVSEAMHDISNAPALKRHRIA